MGRKWSYGLFEETPKIEIIELKRAQNACGRILVSGIDLNLVSLSFCAILPI
jgi:hypothetical protein